MQSKLTLSTKLAHNKTQLDDYFVSPPFKLMTLPNYEQGLAQNWQDGLNAMQMSSSPGLLAGDLLEIQIQLAEQTALTLTTQAFTRVQAMNEGDYAEQRTQIRLAKNSRLFYLPHPLVLHKDSALKQTTVIEMQPDSELIYGEIVAIGRVLNDERFAFRHFASSLKIYQAEPSGEKRPLLSDRIQWLPAQMNLTALSQMEDYSHQGSMVWLNLGKTPAEIKQGLSQFQRDLENEPAELLIGLSQLNEGGLMIRVLGHRADQIQSLFERIGASLKRAF